MSTKIKFIKRSIYGSLALVLLLAVVAPTFNQGKVLAAQLASRSITMSDSAESGGSITTGVGSGTNVTYKFGFTTSLSADSLVIDFCQESPIIADTCTAPTGMSVSTVTLTSVTGNIGTTGWLLGTGSASQVKIYNSTGTAAAAGAQVFTLSGITNQSTASTSPVFYARIYTFANNTYGTYTSATAPGDYEDYGGIALSTNQIISITARVQETLRFCVSGAAPVTWTTTHDCNDPQAAVSAAITLGHGTPTPTLDQTAVDSATVYSQLSTNATNGAVISMRNSNTTCGGLSANGGTTCAIPAVGSTASAIVAGTADFGMAIGPSVDDTNGVGTLTPAATYYNSADYVFTGGLVPLSTPTGNTVPTNVYYGMNATNVESTYGDTVASSTTPLYRVDDAYTFAATAALTTPAGIYTANMDLIATGTF